MNKSVLITIIAAAVIVPGAVYAVSPYFTETTIDEPSPVATSGDNMELMEDGDAMVDKGDDAMMEKDDAMMGDAMAKEISGGFEGAG
ncbi:MAG TPA: hypothetical protein VFZ05_04675, partial [Nitrososphaera sp.]